MIKSHLFKIIGKSIRLYNKVVQPFSIGVRALVFNDQGQVLLVKHSYIASWYIPGGGVNKKEKLLDALQRELREELGLSILKEPKLLGTYSNFFEGKSDYITIFVIDDFRVEPKDALEIEEYRFFSLDHLPDDISPGSLRRIHEYMGTKKIDYVW